MPDTFPLMIFAAGFGTRMGALTRDLPKPLIEVGGRSLINHALRLADDCPQVGRLAVNLHYLGDEIRAHLARRRDIGFSEERPDILETGGGLRQALPLLAAAPGPKPGPVMTLNPDAIWTGANPLSALARTWNAGSMDALLMLVPRDAAIGHTGAGDFDRDAAGQLRRGRALVYAGAQILNPELLSHVAERAFSLNRVWDIAAARGRLFGAVHDGRWCDVGRAESLALAEALLRSDPDV